MGKNCFLSFPVAPFFATLFPVFGHNYEKRVKKDAERQKNGWKDVERGRGVDLPLSKFSNLARFLFLYGLKLLFAPFKTRY